MLLNTQTSYIISSVATTDKTENVKYQSIIIKNGYHSGSFTKALYSTAFLNAPSLEIHMQIL